MRIQVKLKPIYFLLSALITFNFFGCSDVYTPVGDNAKYAPSSPADWASIQNPNNPFNEVGALHNECLANIESVVHPNGPKDVDAGMDQLIVFIQDSTWYESYVTKQWLLGIADSADYYYDLHYQSAPQEEKDFLDAITSAIFDSSNALNADGIDATLIPRLASIESDILASNLQDSEKCIPLLYVAIAKHSTAYWSVVMTSEGFNGTYSGLSKTAWPAWLREAWKVVQPVIHEDARVGAATAVGVGIISLITPVTAVAGGAAIVGGAATGSFLKATE